MGHNIDSFEINTTFMGKPTEFLVIPEEIDGWKHYLLVLDGVEIATVRSQADGVKWEITNSHTDMALSPRELEEIGKSIENHYK